jgi:hypothetical protein
MHRPAASRSRSAIRTATVAGIIAASLGAAASAQSVSVTLDGAPIGLNPPPITRDGRVFVPLRGVFEQLGASVVYANGAINAQGNGHAVQLHIGSNRATVDGNGQQLDVAPFLLGASTYVPLRFVSQALGAQVNYDAGSKVVALASGNAQNQAITPAPQRIVAQPPAPSALTLRALQPGANATLAARRPRIEAQFDQAQADPNSVHVTLDGLDVTNDASRAPGGIVYSPPSDLQFGQHTMRVTGLDDAHRPFDRTWQFTTAAAPVASALALRAIQPESNSATDARRPRIEAQFAGAQADPNTVRVVLDGLDVSGESTRSPGGIVYSPPSDLQFGQHTVHITGRDDSQRTFDRAWQFATVQQRAVAAPSALTLRAVQPEAGAAVQTRRPTIEAQFAGAQADQNTIRIALDGLDVTGEATRSPNGVVYSPPSDLQSGQHTIHVTGRDTNQRPFDRVWQFTSGTAAITNFISDLRPVDEALVGSQLIVAGRTAPNAHLVVQIGTVGQQPSNVTARIGALLGIGPRSDSVRVETDADAGGVFSVQVQIGAESGQRLALVVDSSEPRTHASARVQRALVVR